MADRKKKVNTEPAGEPVEIAAGPERDYEAELAAEKERYLRLAAEYDNFRKRTAKEREGLLEDAFALAVSAFLPLIDNLERAEKFAEGDAAGVREGLALILKQLGETMQRIGLTELNPAGEPFDPEKHNAVAHVDDDSFGENTVAEVLQKGYRVGEKIVRHAMVKVAN